MAKLTKSEAIDAARNLARKNDVANAMTVEQINAMDYFTKQTLATDLAKSSSFIEQIEPQDRYVGDALNAYEEQIKTGWAHKVKTLDNARRAFKHAADGLTMEQATDKIVALLDGMRIRGARISTSSMEVLRGDRDGATLYFRFERDGRELIDPDDAHHTVTSYRLDVTISTSGTSYSPARMAMVHEIQRELLVAANELEATFAGVRVVYVYGGKVEAPAIAEAVQA